MVRPVTPTLTPGSTEVKNAEISLDEERGEFQSTLDGTQVSGASGDTEIDLINDANDEELEGAVGFSSYESLDQSKLVDQDCNEEETSQKKWEGNELQGSVTTEHECRRRRQHSVDGSKNNETKECSDVVDDGLSLYQAFLREEFERRDVRDPPVFSPNSSWSQQMRHGSQSADVIQAGLQLRSMAEQFARSPMRLWVQQQAEAVPLQTLDSNSFSDLLYGLFQEGGVTWERVVVLFFFCADLSIRALREKLEGQFHNIIEWSFQFIGGERFSRWVETNGGWAKILEESVDHMYKLAVIGFCAMGMLAFAAYLWRSK